MGLSPGSTEVVAAATGSGAATTVPKGDAATGAAPAPPSRWYSGPRQGPVSYYDLPLLKRPVWGWEIAGYFFFGGLTAGTYLLSRLCGRRLLGTAGSAGRRLRRRGSVAALVTLLPCPVLLILDLGVPRRFLYMLRVFKPGSPMSVGSWVLTAYGAVTAASVVLDSDALWSGVGLARLGPGARRGLGLAVDALGLPLAVAMAGYTGVLLSSTATPVWTRSPWLGPLFSASALRTGVSALQLLAGRSWGGRRLARALGRIDWLLGAVEAGTLLGHVLRAGPLAAPLVRGPQARVLLGGAVGVGLVAPVLLRRAARGRRGLLGRVLDGSAAVLGLVGGLCLRWALVHAGRASAADARATRLASAPSRAGCGPRRASVGSAL